jgi:H+/Cl- antiporter ClcA
MQATVERPAGTSRWMWASVWVQVLVVLAYSYAVVAYLVTDAEYFPEQAPPAWSWPAVLAVGVGFIPGLLCLLVALPLLASADFRAEHRQWRLLGMVSAASVVMLLVMATPPGWELFDWYVG